MNRATKNIIRMFATASFLMNGFAASAWADDLNFNAFGRGGGGFPGGGGPRPPMPNPRPQPQPPRPQPNPSPSPHRPGPHRPDRPQPAPRPPDRPNPPQSNHPNRPNPPGRPNPPPMHRPQDRTDWHARYNTRVRRDVTVIRSPSTWTLRYDRWRSYHPRPAPIVIPAEVRWIEPMPVIDTWNVNDVAVISDNLEGLTRDIFRQMDEASAQTPNREYAARLMGALATLVDAAENFNDAVLDGEESLNDLFYLESVVGQAETTIDGYSRAYLVDGEMRTLRYYVNELLWLYGQR